MINILCTSKPGDGLFCYSYEHCHYLNEIGIQSQVVVITHPQHQQKDYIDTINSKYIVCENIIFDEYIPSPDDICFILGRSMLTLPYKNRSDYTNIQLSTIRLLVSELAAVYSENHPIEYPLAFEYFGVKRVQDFCDFAVYPDAEVNALWYEKMINFSIYKPVKENVKYEHLFLGTNKEYYAEVEKHIDFYPNSVILAYDDKYINPKHNHIFVPVENLLGLFNTYVYTKPTFDPAPRLLQECKWLKKKIIYARDGSIEDGGMAYFSRPVPTKVMYKQSIKTLVKEFEEWRTDIYRQE